MKLLLRLTTILLGMAMGLCVTAQQRQIRGIDVSHHQGRIDWTKVASDNIAFVYIKATEGKTYVDPHFRENVKGACNAGLWVGAYHYFRMTSTPCEQFNNFKQATKGLKMTLIPMIDVETGDGYSIQKVQKCLDELIALMKKEYGVLPMIYGTQRSYNTFCAHKYNHHHLYIGRYRSSEPPVIFGNGTYTIWQYTENGRVQGIPKEVDLCKFHPKHSLSEIRMK
jgi:lysozyme